MTTKKSIFSLFLLFSFNGCNSNNDVDIGLVGTWSKPCQKYDEAQYYMGTVTFKSNTIIETKTNYYQDTNCTEVNSLEENIITRTYHIGDVTEDVRGESATELDTFIANDVYYRMVRIMDNRLYLSVSNDPFNGTSKELRANKFDKNDYFTREY